MANTKIFQLQFADYGVHEPLAVAADVFVVQERSLQLFNTLSIYDPRHPFVGDVHDEAAVTAIITTEPFQLLEAAAKVREK